MIQRNPNGNRRSGPQRQQPQNGLPFLSTKEVTHSKQPGVIVAARVQADSFRVGQQVVAMRINFKGQHWIYNLRTSNPNLDTLCEAWGDDELKWAGKEILIFAEEDDLTAKVWLRLEPAAPEPVETYEEVSTGEKPKGRPRNRK